MDLFYRSRQVASHCGVPTTAWLAIWFRCLLGAVVDCELSFLKVIPRRPQTIWARFGDALPAA